MPPSESRVSWTTETLIIALPSHALAILRFDGIRKFDIYAARYGVAYRKRVRMDTWFLLRFPPWERFLELHSHGV